MLWKKSLSDTLQNEALVGPTQVVTTVNASYLQQIELSSGPLDLRALLIPLHIDYQATTFGHQYSFGWHSLFEHDISAQSSPPQNLRFLTATSRLGPVPKPRLQPGPRTFSLSDPSISSKLLSLHQVFICRTHALPRAALVLRYVSNQAN